MNVGDLVLCRNKLYGLVLEIDDSDFDLDGIMWALILWDNFRACWEEISNQFEASNCIEVVQ